MKDTKNIKKFLKTVFARKVTVINAIIVLIFIFLAIFAPFVAPYDPDKPFTKQYFTDHRYDDTAGRFHYPGRSRFKLPGTWYQRSNGFLGKHGK